MNLFGLPMDAGANDLVIGYDELGRPVRRSLLGHEYGAAYAEPPPVAAPIQGRAERARASRDAFLGLLGEAVKGFTAPGRAARGEPVTLGEAWATALDGYVPGVGASVPEGALRANAMRGFHGSGNTNIESFRVRRGPRGDLRDAAYFAIDEPGTDARGYAKSYTWNRETGEEGTGRIYEVDIPANPGILDARIPEDRARMVAALDKSDRIPMGGADYLAQRDRYNTGLPGWGDDTLMEVLDEQGFKGVVLQERPPNANSGGVVSAAIFDPEAVNIIKPGIRVYHDRLIEIVRKYGVAGAAVMLGLSTQEVQDAMDQPRGLLGNAQ